MGMFTSSPVKNKSGGFFTSKGSATSSSSLGSGLAEIQALAKQSGIEPPKNKVGTLSRLFGLLSAGETAPAMYELLTTGDIGKAGKKYGEEALKGATLQGLSPEKKTYADVLKLLGMPEGKIWGPISARGALGLVGDIALDPTTYVGGTLVKQGGKVAKTLGKPVLKTAGKIKPLAKVAEAAADLGGGLFKPGYELEKTLGKTGRKYLGMTDELFKKTRAKAMTETEAIGVLSGKAQKQFGKDIGEKLAQKVETGVAKSDPLKPFADIITKGHKEFSKAEKARGLLKTDLPNYLRHYLTPEGREFIGLSGRDTMSELLKPFRPKLGAAKPRKLTGTIKEINDYFVKNHGVKLFEPDAFKAFAGRTVENIKAVKMYDFLDNVGKEFGMQAPKNTDKIIKDGMFWTKSSAPQLKNVLLPEPIAKHLDETKKIFSNDEATNQLVKYFDRALSFWKGSVTAIWPGFHTRNFIGGSFNNYLAGLKNPARYAEGFAIASGKTGNIVTKAGKKIGYDEIRDLVKNLGVSGQPGYGDVFKTIDDIVKEMGQSKARNLVNKIIPGKYWMQAIEDRLRIPLFVDRLVKGDTAQEAAKMVFKYHFDYAPEALTAFERNYMKRLIPFYRWMRGNVPLQMEQMVKQPGKYSAIAKTFRSLRGQKGQDEAQYLPEYMQEQFPIRLGENKGESQYLYGLGLPVEDLGRIFDASPVRTIEKLLATVNPAIKVPLEIGTQRNFFYGKPMGEVDYVYDYIGKIPGMKEVLGLTKRTNQQGGTYFISSRPEVLHLLNSFLSRFYTTFGKVSKKDSSLITKLLYTAFGTKARGVNIEREKYYREREQTNELEQQLEKMGIMKKFEKYYVPKT